LLLGPGERGGRFREGAEGAKKTRKGKDIENLRTTDALELAQQGKGKERGKVLRTDIRVQRKVRTKGQGRSKTGEEGHQGLFSPLAGAERPEGGKGSNKKRNRGDGLTGGKGEENARIQDI